MTNEERQLENIKRRRRGSLEKVIDMYTPYISVIVYNIIGAVMTREDIEEVVSDVFISFWRNAENLDSTKGNLRTYLGAAARNCAKNKLRQLSVHEELDVNFVDGGQTPEECLQDSEDRALILQLIKSLGEPDSEIFLRYYWYEEKISQIAAATGLCSSTITTKLSRGRKKLKEILKEVRK